MFIENNLLGFLICLLCIIGLYKKKDIYTIFLSGVLDGLKMFLNLFPTMLALFLAIELLQQTTLISLIESILSFFHLSIPPAIIPMALLRSFSGNASLSALISIFKQYGPDSLEGLMASVMQGASDTTFYVITLYFSHIQIKKMGRTLPLSLLADAIAVAFAIYFSLIVFS